MIITGLDKLLVILERNVRFLIRPRMELYPITRSSNEMALQRQQIMPCFFLGIEISTFMPNMLLLSATRGCELLNIVSG